MPPNAPRVPGSSECAASLPEAPECVASPASDTSPEASECDTCPRVPNPKPNPGALRVRRVSRGHSRWELLRMLPSQPRVPRGRAPRAPPGSSPSGPSPERPSRELSECAGPRAPHRETSRALGEHATCPRERLSSSRNLENVQKIDRTLEMHHKSNFDPKNAIPIFMALYCLVLPRKNTKPTEKTKLPLRKIL